MAKPRPLAELSRGVDRRCFALCRRLVAAGYDPATPLEAYRGDVLCLKVRAIGEAAGLQINSHGTDFEPVRQRRAGSPMSPAEAPAIPLAGT
jgi:hypothetical protein